jgi:hypothetical protein
MGLTVDPSFASNRFIYACYTATGDNRVVRWQVNNTLNGVTGAGTVLVQGLSKANFHDGCRIRFGPDGKLWVTTGDGGVGTHPQNIDSLNGKVLRINSDGSAPGDNPFVGRPGDDRVYTFGHRNPQGISFRPGDNAPYAIEHGPGANDEVNVLIAGGNGGWDPVPGYNQNVPMTDLQKFPDAMIPAWRSGRLGHGGAVGWDVPHRVAVEVVERRARGGVPEGQQGPRDVPRRRRERVLRDARPRQRSAPPQRGARPRRQPLHLDRRRGRQRRNLAGRAELSAQPVSLRGTV